MATNEVLQVYPSNVAQVMFRDATDWDGGADGPPNTAANDLRLGAGANTVQLDLTSIAAAAARQSAKVQIFNGAGPEFVTLGACIEWAGGSLPTAGGKVDFYANFSPNTAAATGNSGGATGLDAAFTVADVTQLVFLGSMTVLNAAINIDASINTRIFLPYEDMSLIVVNNTDEAFHTDMHNTHIVLTATVPDIQAAA